MIPMLAVALMASAAADTSYKLSVVPFVPLSGEVPSGAGDKAADVLVTALKEHEGLLPQVVGGEQADDPSAHLKKAQALLSQGRSELDKGHPAQALGHLQTAMGELVLGAGAMDDPDTLADAWCSLARAAYQAGDDATGLTALDDALALRPDRPFPEIASSSLFANLVASEKSRIQALDKASARIDSSPPGAAVHIDGLEAGRTPLMIKELVPGAHLWRVELPSGGSVGGVVTVAAGGKARVLGAGTAQGPSSSLDGVLMTNLLDKDSPNVLRDVSGKLATPLLVFGAMHLEGSDLVLDSFLYWREPGAFVRLPRVKFDPDLMSAGQELSRVAADIAGRMTAGSLGVPTPIPARIADGVSPDSAEVTEFVYPAPGDTALQPEAGPRKVVGAQHGPVKK